MKRNNKIIIIGLTSICVIVCILVLLISFLNGKNKNSNNDSNKKVENYIAYVSINPVVKLNFKIECQSDNCSDPIVTNYSLVNEDAKEIYKDTDLKDKSLKESLKLLNTFASDNEINTEYINVFTDWEDGIKYISDISPDSKYVVKHLEIEELTNDDFETELLNDPYIIVEVEIPASLTVKSCNHKTKLLYNDEYDSAFICGPSEYCGYMTYETHPEIWNGYAYACLLSDVNGCVIKIPFNEPVIKVRIRTKQTVYDRFKANKCYELTYDKYCLCKDSYVKAEFDRDGIDEVGKHKVNATIKSSANIEILPFENGIPYIEFELGMNENYEQEQNKCLSDGVGTTMPLPSCSNDKK